MPLDDRDGQDDTSFRLFALERSRSLADLDPGVARLTALLPGPLTPPNSWRSPLSSARWWAPRPGTFGRRGDARERPSSWPRLLDLRFGPIDAMDRVRLGDAEAEHLLA
jgi:hypothetical protein